MSYTGPSRSLKNSFVLLVSRTDKSTKLWVASVMLLFLMHEKDFGEEKESTFVQYMDVTTPLDNVSRAL